MEEASKHVYTLVFPERKEKYLLPGQVLEFHYGLCSAQLEPNEQVFSFQQK